MQPDHRCTNLRRPCAGERSIYELLSDRDERNAVRVEHLDHLREVGERSSQPVDLVDDHYVDKSPPDIFQQALQGGALHCPARKASIIVGRLDKPPALARLALDERLSRLTLRVQRVEVLL